MKVRSKEPFPFKTAKNILVRSTNWIGDAVMTLPAMAAIRKNLPDAQITVLAKPWVAELFHICPDVDDVMIFQAPGIHEGLSGRFQLAAELRKKRFDAAILLQNAIEAAILSRLAGIRVRVGYNSDIRGFLLTHSVQRTKTIRRVHQIDYYLEMVKSLGFMSAGREVKLRVGRDYADIASSLFENFNIPSDKPLIGIAPGATYGPAKMWFPERFATVADRFTEELAATILLFGSQADRAVTEKVRRHAFHPLIDIAGKTSLKEAMALIARCRLFLSNDSGLMHVAGAMGIPTVAVFGSTNPVTTSPVGEKSVIVTKSVSCSPCLKKTCDTDFRCMDLITVDDIYEAAKNLWL
jgi:heptosyltransferase-2